MKKFWERNRKIIYAFFVWRIALFIVAYFSRYLFPIYGGRFPYSDTALQVTKLPNWIWGFGGFDGVHYLRIAQNGYVDEYVQAFFPVFPNLVKYFALLFPSKIGLDLAIFVDPRYFFSGLILANMFFLFALIYYYKLIRIDYKERVAWFSTILLLVFPTSFYFGAIYSESLFVSLVVVSLYLVRKRKYISSGVSGMIASATRLVGVLLVPTIAIEIVQQIKEGELKKSLNELIKPIVGILIVPLGVILYMIYLNKTFNDALLFLNAQPGFGADRSAKPFILFPQVVYRYLKMIVTVPPNSYAFFTTILELSFFLGGLLLLIYTFRKIRMSYWFFSLTAFLLPTLTGTFSSMPRYSLMLFLLFPLIVKKLESKSKLLIISSTIASIILLSLFVRGYWVA